MLKDRSQLQNGRFLSQSEKVKGRQNEEDRSEIKHQQAFLARIASIGVGHVLEQKGEGQEIALEGEAHPGVINRRVKLLQRLLHERELQSIGIHNSLEIVLAALPCQDFLASGLHVEQKQRDRKDQDHGR